MRLSVKQRFPIQTQIEKNKKRNITLPYNIGKQG